MTARETPTLAHLKSVVREAASRERPPPCPNTSFRCALPSPPLGGYNQVLEKAELIFEALKQPRDSVFTAVNRALAQAMPERAVVETGGGVFDVMQFYGDGKCTLIGNVESISQWTREWSYAEERSYDEPYNVWLDCDWEGKQLELLMVGIEGSSCRTERWYVVADEAETANNFVDAVYKWCTEIRGEVLVFSEGQWHKSQELYKAISAASLDSLILAGNLKQEIRSDFRQFLDSEEMYSRYGIPWKLGVLFLGPPGNGKTHAIKGLVNELNVPCLYVQSMTAHYMSDQSCVNRLFERARTTTPCILILEDIDALVTDKNRSFFLNEMDGFSANHGILTIATTNHPDRLDPAILDRPSRFDRKYLFSLPEVQERRQYSAMINAKLEDELKLDAAGIEAVADETAGFSFAYLKELFTSAMMKWIASPGDVPMSELMLQQISTLREQMATSLEQLEGARSAESSSFEDFEEYARRFMPPGF